MSTFPPSSITKKISSKADLVQGSLKRGPEFVNVRENYLSFLFIMNHATWQPHWLGISIQTFACLWKKHLFCSDQQLERCFTFQQLGKQFLRTFVYEFITKLMVSQNQSKTLHQDFAEKQKEALPFKYFQVFISNILELVFKMAKCRSTYRKHTCLSQHLPCRLAVLQKPATSHQLPLCRMLSALHTIGHCAGGKQPRSHLSPHAPLHP